MFSVAQAFEHAMETRRLGASDLEITRVGLGTAPIGSGPGWWVNWGAQDAGDAIRTIRTALDVGVNWIDTAPFYGWGRAEELVGEAIRGRRDSVYVFTKCGTLRRDDGDDYMDLRPEAIRRDVEASLRRLGTDYVDLLQPHDPDRSVPIEETWGEVMRLVDEGKVRHGGLSNHPPELVERALAVGPVVSLQHQYSLLARAAERDVLPFARARGIGVLTWAPLASGFLTDTFEFDSLEPEDFRRRHPFAEQPLGPLRNELREAAGTAQAGAIAWVLANPAVTGAIVGARTEREARELPELASTHLDGRAKERVEAALRE
jgi:aryl-alcohol dehydrogenase-like predicted oxidoreductase